jgi:type IX secretion system PorP/SprF family membrane protein
MKKNSYISILGILFSLVIHAQQDPSFSQYFFNPMYYNPGYAGSRGVLSGTLVDRSQWVGMSGAPETQSLNLHSAIPNSKIGLGLQVMTDKAGPLRNTSFGLIFAYHLHLGPEARLAFGIEGLLNDLHLDFDKLAVENPADQSFINNSNSSWVPDASAGLYFYKRRFYAGLASTNLIQSRFKFQNTEGANLAKFFRHYYFMTGVVKDISENFAIRPSLLIKAVEAAPVVFDLNASVIYKQQLYLGLGYRFGKRIDIGGMDNMLVANIEYDFKNFLRFGYSYDVYLNRSGNYNSGTHEIMVGWDLDFTKTKMTGPRFF